MRHVGFQRRFSKLAFALLALSAGPGFSAEEVVPQRVQALLKNRCVKCHGPLRPQGKLDLSSLRSLSRGGENGPVIQFDQPLDSPLWQRIAANEMPPENPLPADERQLLQTWIEGGAAGVPREMLPPAVGLDHWAFQKLGRPAAPTVKDGSRVRSTVDAFLQATLERQGLGLGPDTDRRTLIRRIAFDLTGLPPSPEEIAEFLVDVSPDADARLMDRYLASPCYGERWGQFWLDAAGYADSSGYFSNERERPLAWRYRDYVIESFNCDRPFDQFVREQLAGDELIDFRIGQKVTPDGFASLIATQYLANAPDGTDQSAGSPDAMRVDRYAALEGTQQIIASSLLGLSLKCARCHDHKFEPISQAEYYQIQSILVPALNPANWIPPLQRKVRISGEYDAEQWVKRTEQIQERQAVLAKEATALLEQVSQIRERGETVFHDDFAGTDGRTPERWQQFDGKGTTLPETVLAKEAATAIGAWRRDGALHVSADGGRAFVATLQAFDWTPDREGDWIQASFFLVNDRLADGAVQALRVGYYLSLYDPQLPRGAVVRGDLLIDGNPTAATTVYYDAISGTPSKPLGNLAAEPYRPGHFYGVRITNIGGGKYRLQHLLDWLPEGTTMDLTADDLPPGPFGFYRGHNRSFIVDDVRIETGSAAKDQSNPAAGRSPEFKKLLEQRESLLKESQALRNELSAGSGSEISWVSDVAPTPPDVFLLQRGNYGQNGDPVQPSGLAVLSDPDNAYAIPTRPEGRRTTGRRLALAQWLTAPEARSSALVARVQMNRLWMHYFGRGLTPDADNFGLSGSPPVHPELLEHLSSMLVDSGWHFKRLHRLILQSTVYRQASIASPAGQQADPNNRGLWRRPLRRLDSEEVRDAMLAVSGELDGARGGPYVPIDAQGTEQEKARGTLNREITVNEATPGAHRRSIYIQHKRMQLPTFLTLFDLPSISGNCVERPSSTVVLQSLAQLNSDFIRMRAAAMAQRLAREAGDAPEARIRLAFVLATGRDASPEEVQDSQAFLQQQRSAYSADADTAIWTDFCQMLLASNLFLYLE